MKQETINTKVQAIINAINEMPESELVRLNNLYCQSANYSDNEIFENDEDFFETFFSGEVLKAVQAVSYGEYNYSDNYVIFNGYGNLDSFSYMSTDKLCELVPTIAEYVADNEEDFEGLFEGLEYSEEEEN